MLATATSSYDLDLSLEEIEPGLPFLPIGAPAIAVLRAMSGRLSGRLERDASFVLEAAWSGPVPRDVAAELHDAGLIEIDETAGVGDAYTFRISEAGLVFLNSMQSAGH